MKHIVSGSRCPLGTCDWCTALARKEQDARCPNRPETHPAVVYLVCAIAVAIGLAIVWAVFQ